jgi:hypothetical protein
VVKDKPKGEAKPKAKPRAEPKPDIAKPGTIVVRPGWR